MSEAKEKNIKAKKKKINKPKLEKEVVVLDEKKDTNDSKELNKELENKNIVENAEKSEEDKIKKQAGNVPKNNTKKVVKKKKIKAPNQENLKKAESNLGENTSSKNFDKSKDDKKENELQDIKENDSIKDVEIVNPLEKIDLDAELSSKEEPKEESKQEVKETEKKDLITAPNKEVVQTKEKPEYVQEMIQKRKRRRILIGLIVGLILAILLFSTIFAILNMNNSKIINGIKVKNIDVSSLNKYDAIIKTTEAINKELIPEITLTYGEEYSVTIKPEQIEFEYNVNDAIDEVYQIGRQGNVILDNYSIIYAMVFGKENEINYTYNGELLTQFVEDINSKIPGIVVNPTYYIEENKLFITKGTDGIQVKSEELKNKIIDSILKRNANELTDDFKQVIEIPIENVKAAEIDMKKIHSEIYHEPKDAYYETEPYKIYPDVDGVDLTMTVEEAQKIIEKETKEEYTFDLKITKADKTLDDLGTEAFPYLISQFSTKYDASNRNRSTNLEIAANKINGKVLMPGDEFSFNKIVGKRTVEEGYKEAAIYADGGVVDGLAGGICQISTTLYNSVLLANLQIVERRNHSFTTSYAPAGRDATVVWGRTDFRFINSRTYPIKIEATVKNGIAEFKIYGMQEETEYEVRILPVRTQSIPFTTTYEESPTVPPGQPRVKQAGHSGCKVTTYKELRLNGEVVSKEPISNDTYLPMRTIIRVAPGEIPAQ